MAGAAESQSGAQRAKEATQGQTPSVEVNQPADLGSAVEELGTTPRDAESGQTTEVPEPAAEGAGGGGGAPVEQTGDHDFTVPSTSNQAAQAAAPAQFQAQQAGQREQNEQPQQTSYFQLLQDGNVVATFPTEWEAEWALEDIIDNEVEESGSNVLSSKYEIIPTQDTTLLRSLVPRVQRRIQQQQQQQQAQAQPQTQAQAQPQAQQAPAQQQTQAQPQAQQAQTQQWPPQTPAQPQAQGQQQQVVIPPGYSDLTPEEAVEKFWNDSFFDRQHKAIVNNRINEDNDDYDEDLEAFSHLLSSLLREHYTGLNRDNPDVFEQEYVPEVNFEFKETLSLDRYIQRVIHTFKIGFFHVATEHLEFDEKGNPHMRWGGRHGAIETRIERLCDVFGLDPYDTDSQRTIFRLVLLYASLSIDTHNQVFHERNGEWVMFEDNFTAICDNIYASCINFGYPFAPPWQLEGYMANPLKKLGGTNIYPAGVLPRVVAEAITGPKSQLRVYTELNPDGIRPTAGALIAMCEAQWKLDVHPRMLKDLEPLPDRRTKKEKKEGVKYTEGDKFAQRLAIERMNQALARIDGVGPEEFSSRFGVDTAPHYHIDEYTSLNQVYASAMNNKFDAQAAAEYQKRLADEVKKKLQGMSSREYSAASAIAGAAVSLIKTNSLFWQVPIALSAIGEKGVGCLQTEFAIKSISHAFRNDYGVPEMKATKRLEDAFKTKEASEAIDAALMLLELGGPQALLAFSKTNEPLKHSTATAWARENLMKHPNSTFAAEVQEKIRWWEEKQQMILAGDWMFKKKDAMNYLNALLVSNQAIIATQNRLEAEGRLDDHAGQAFTVRELDDALQASQADLGRGVQGFLTEVLATSAGRDALIMMRANNIANFNPLGHMVNGVLKNHGIGDFAVTTWVDSFATYSVNFLYTLVPLSRSMAYVAMKAREASGKDITAGMMVPGGGLANVEGLSFPEMLKDPAFQMGLRMNFTYDAMSFGRWGITALIIGSILSAFGFEPPDDPNDLLNISMWKIGGEEIQNAFWINDLTQLGLPAAYALAAFFSGQPADLCGKLALSSLYDQVDGNVVIDLIELVRKWPSEMAEMEKMKNDPTYEGKFDPSLSILELTLSMTDKIVLGAPLYRAFNRSSWGDYSDAHDYTKAYDKSSQWAIDVGKVDYIEDRVDRTIRKHSSGNWLLAAIMNVVSGYYFGKDKDKKTGYFYSEMPIKKVSEDQALYWAERQKMDYTDRSGCTTDAAYNEKRADDLMKEIDQVIEAYGGIDQAIMNGYIVTSDIRKATLDVLTDRVINLEIEFKAKEASGQIVKKTPAYYAESDRVNAEKNRLWDYINILRRDDLPSWTDGYRQLVTDYDVSYVDKDGNPVTPWVYLADTTGEIQAIWHLKGNHPNAFIPFPWTGVDTRSSSAVTRLENGETVPRWAKSGENGGVNPQAIHETLGKELVPSGRNAGKTFDEVYFGVDENGELIHPDQVTTGQRALVPIDRRG